MRLRSGKSTCKTNRVYNKKVYIVSPSLKTAKNDPFACLPDDQIEQELTVDFLHRFEEEISGIGEKVLLMLDDVVNDIRKNKGVDKVLAFKLKNVKEILSIYNEFVMGLSKEQFMDLKVCLQGPIQFSVYEFRQPMGRDLSPKFQ